MSARVAARGSIKLDRPRVWWPVAVLSLFGTAARVWLLRQPMDRLVQWTVLDDAFYYFVIARHIASGAGSTFDGLHLTNGYHPLWMGALVVLYRLLGSGLRTVYIALGVESVLGILAGAALALLGSRVFDSKTLGALVFGLWMVNHRIIGFTYNGMETGVVLLTLPLLGLSALAVLREPTLVRSGLFGLCAALAVMARTDNALLVALLLLLILLSRGWKPAGVAATVAGLLVLPWFWWSYATFGTVLQDSATAVTYGLRMQLAAEGRSSLGDVARFLLYTWAQSIKRVYFVTGLPTGPFAWMTVLWLAVAVAMAMRAYLRSRGRTFSGQLARALLRSPEGMIVGVLSFLWPFVLVTVHVGWRWHFRSHYYASLAPGILLAFAALVWFTWRAGRCGRLWVALLPLLMAFAAFQWAAGPLYRHQLAAFHAAQWLDEHAEICPTVGAFNAGIMGMFYTQGRVINLDGVVNHAALEALRAGVLGEYARTTGVACLADMEPQPGTLLRRAAWGRVRPAQNAALLWREAIPGTDFPWTSIYQTVWESNLTP